jgi:amino acid transporter
VICQETDGRFCASDKYFLLYYYIPVSIAVLVISQIKNYKQVSYIAKVAMIATVVAIIVLLIDAILQILVYMRVEYYLLEGNTVQEL